MTEIHANADRGSAQGVRTESRTMLAIMPEAPADRLVAVLTEVARQPTAFALDSLDMWWQAATAPSRLRVVLGFARALHKLDGATTGRLADPRWRHVLGLPLWLATFVTTRRLQRHSRAANTLRAWASDWRCWRLWCKRHGLPSFNPSAHQLDRFLRDYAPAHKRATTQRWGASLTAMHKAAGLPDPLDAPLAAEIWRAATAPSDRTARGRRRRADDDRRNLPQAQAAGLTRDVLERALAACGDRALIDLRDAALIALAYDMLARRSELVAVHVEDIAWAADGSATLHVQRSKTDQTGTGTALYLRPDTARRLRRWCDQARITDGPVFRSLRGGGVRSGACAAAPALPAQDVLRILRRRVAVVDPDLAGRISGHSGRVGAAQDLSAAGISDTAIAHAGRWTTTTQVVRYTKAQAARKGGMAQLAAIQAQTDG